MLRKAGDTHARAHVHVLIFKCQGLLKGFCDALCHGHSRLCIATTQNHRKLVAA